MINAHACSRQVANGFELTGMGRLDCDACDLHETTFSQDELNEKYQAHLRVHADEFAAAGVNLDSPKG